MGICVGVCPPLTILAAGSVDLTLSKRTGFVKLALEHGAGLVPVFTFGENELWSQVSGEGGQGGSGSSRRRM